MRHEFLEFTKTDEINIHVEHKKNKVLFSIILGGTILVIVGQMVFMLIYQKFDSLVSILLTVGFWFLALTGLYLGSKKSEDNLKKDLFERKKICLKLKVKNKIKNSNTIIFEINSDSKNYIKWDSVINVSEEKWQTINIGDLIAIEVAYYSKIVLNSPFGKRVAFINDSVD